MAIFVDLENEDETTEALPSPSHPPEQSLETLTTSLESTRLEETIYLTPRSSRPDLASLAAPYPVIYSIASNLDHNDLSNLANTCKQMRENMLQYRNNLLGASLVCSTEAVEAEKPELQKKKRRILCVRDLVARCGTCGEPTCRNCVFKPGKLTDEHRKRLACRVRRICRQCQTSPEVLHPDPNSNVSHKICNCASKLLWQCPACRLSSAPLTTHKSFLTLLHHEKLQLLKTILCTHFRPSLRPPNSQLVWVEECPSPTHSPRLKPADPSHNHKPITCAMEVYPGGWAYQDLTTGYIHRPSSSSCIGATADWWSRLVSDPNEGGLITYPTSAELGPEYTFRRVSCTDSNHPRWALMAGKGLDARGVGVALWSYDQKHGMLEEEKKGEVRAGCIWCEGVVLTREEENERGMEGIQF